MTMIIEYTYVKQSDVARECWLLATTWHPLTGHVVTDPGELASQLFLFSNNMQDPAVYSELKAKHSLVNEKARKHIRSASIANSFTNKLLGEKRWSIHMSRDLGPGVIHKWMAGVGRVGFNSRRLQLGSCLFLLLFFLKNLSLPQNQASKVYWLAVEAKCGERYWWTLTGR